MDIKPVCVNDFERLAKHRLSEPTYNYFSCGTANEVALRDNINSFADWRIHPRTLRDVSKVDTISSIFGNSISFPVCISPTAMHGLVHDDAEVATAKGALKANTGFTLSAHSNKSLEEVAASAPNAILFMQLYIWQNKDLTLQLIQRAEKNGYKAVVLNVDAPIYPKRKPIGKQTPDFRYGNFLPLGTNNENSDTSIAQPINVKEKLNAIPDAGATWNTLRWLVNSTHLPVIAKGILTGEDACLAVECGVRGIMVSNHGGRQLDTVMSTIDALPDIVAAVNNRCEVYMDGGVRNGTDVFKALALGANAVFIGRPALFALAYDGADGVSNMLDILRTELKATMALSGCRNVKEITRDMIVHTDQANSKL